VAQRPKIDDAGHFVSYEQNMFAANITDAGLQRDRGGKRVVELTSHAGGSGTKQLPITCSSLAKFRPFQPLDRCEGFTELTRFK
jgi:hypothetical protein